MQEDPRALPALQGLLVPRVLVRRVLLVLLVAQAQLAPQAQPEQESLGLQVKTGWMELRARLVSWAQRVRVRRE